MMENKELHNMMKNAAHNATEQVDSKLWERLENKLENKHQKDQVHFYKRIASIAAGLALLAMTYAYLNEKSSYNPDLIASAESNGLILESLQTEENGFYTIENLESMIEAYNEMTIKSLN